MAIATGTALAIAGVASAAQIVAGESRRVKAKRALENFQRQELRNVTEGLRVSTLGAELQTQEAQRRFATSVEALRSGGVRGLVGGLGQQEAQQQRLQQQISADLDRQQMAIEQMRAQDEANIRSMIEGRESAQIAGLGSEMAAGSRMTQAGISGIASTALAGMQVAGLGEGAQAASDAAGAATGVADAAKIIGDTGKTAAQLAGGADGGRGYFGAALQGVGVQAPAFAGLTASSAYQSRFGLSSAGAPQVRFAGPTGGVMEHAGFTKQGG